MNDQNGRCNDVLVALRRLIRATDLHSRHLAKTSGLTSPQLLLLQAIHDNQQVTIRHLADQISLSQATVTTILNRLETRGLVRRQRSDSDRRKVHTHLTKEGQSVLDAAPAPLQSQFVERFSKLDDWEQTAIVSALQRVAHMMDASDLDASPVLDVGAMDRQPEQAE